MKYYAGIGSRNTPDEIQAKMKRLSNALSKVFVLRSGGANGADSAFEETSKSCEIYLPSESFNHRIHDGIKYLNYQKMPGVVQAQDMTYQFHPKADTLSEFAFHLHSRNAMQIFGKDMNHPVDFVICWTPNGEMTGGTAQAIRIANHYNIPVYNLAKPSLLNFMV